MTFFIYISCSPGYMRGETKTKKTNIIYKALHRKLNIEQYEPTKTEGKHWSFGSGSSGTRRLTVVTNTVSNMSRMRKESDCDYIKRKKISRKTRLHYKRVIRTEVITIVKPANAVTSIK